MKGERLGDERFAGEFANIIMQLARKVQEISNQKHIQCCIITQSFCPGQEGRLCTLARSLFSSPADGTPSSFNTRKSSTVQAERISRLLAVIFVSFIVRL